MSLVSSSSTANIFPKLLAHVNRHPAETMSFETARFGLRAFSRVVFGLGTLSFSLPPSLQPSLQPSLSLSLSLSSLYL